MYQLGSAAIETVHHSTDTIYGATFTFINGVLKLSNILSATAPQRKRREPFLQPFCDRHFAGGLITYAPSPPSALQYTVYKYLR